MDQGDRAIYDHLPTNLWPPTTSQFVITYQPICDHLPTNLWSSSSQFVIIPQLICDHLLANSWLSTSQFWSPTHLQTNLWSPTHQFVIICQPICGDLPTYGPICDNLPVSLWSSTHRFAITYQLPAPKYDVANNTVFTTTHCLILTRLCRRILSDTRHCFLIFILFYDNDEKMFYIRRK